MTLVLYGHPFSSFTWKPLIALYERDVAFDFAMLGTGDAEIAARMAQVSPTGQFPVLIDAGRAIVQSNTIIEYCDLHQGNAAPMVPGDARDAIDARMMADIFDDYVNVQFQRVVGDALRAPGERDPRGVEDARATLDRCYAWLDRRLGTHIWASGDRFTIADCAAAPALFYGDWVQPIPSGLDALTAYRARLLARPSVMRVVEEARPYRLLFPLGAPDRD
jgi:glutathione S-transferase